MFLCSAREIAAIPCILPSLSSTRVEKQALPWQNKSPSCAKQKRQRCSSRGTPRVRAPGPAPPGPLGAGAALGTGRAGLGSAGQAPRAGGQRGARRDTRGCSPRASLLTSHRVIAESGGREGGCVVWLPPCEPHNAGFVEKMDKRGPGEQCGTVSVTRACAGGSCLKRFLPRC